MRRITHRSLRSSLVGSNSPQTLPLFPLNAPIVPGLVLPLHIFEPRYRALVAELLAEPVEDRREFGIIAIRDGRRIDRDGAAALFEVGTATVLRQAEELEDGRWDIVTTGTRRFRLLELDASQPLARGRVTWLAEPAGDVTDALVADVSRGFGRYQQLLGGGLGRMNEAYERADDDDEDTDHLPDDPAVLSFLVTAAMVLPVAERQQLLEAPDAAQRLALARTLLRRENGLIAALGAVPALDLGVGQPGEN